MRPARCGDRVEQRVDRGGIGEVRAQRERVGQLGGELVGRFGAGIAVDRDAEPLAGKRAGARRADAARGAGDECDGLVGHRAQRSGRCARGLPRTFPSQCSPIPTSASIAARSPGSANTTREPGGSASPSRRK